MNVADYAKLLGVSPRRVRALIKSKAVAAEKVGRTWRIESDLRRPSERRSLSPKSQDALALALHNRSLKGLSGQTRARTATRIRMLRESENPARLLVDWWGRQKPDGLNGGTNLVEHALRGHDEYVLRQLKARPTEYLRTWDDLATIVRSERAIHGFALPSLAQLADVSLRDLQAIERARPIGSIGSVRRVLRAVDVEPSAVPAPEVR